ncbi:zinc-dependent alcohol dehydrogenase [Rubrobacter indicoceani]|uniref:zinc-dependent alcohol dehydrogenase n=1 Tax=Rubrobacter indicoceani TaxID=2051957 RepID=UPI001F09B705|nr:zinc-binding alcohol dehydrogenase [Rubrobacter indicoceani]
MSFAGEVSGAGALQTEALWFVGVRRAEVHSGVVGSPGPGEVRVAAEFSGISSGTEMLVYRGEVPAGVGLDLPTLEGSFGFPIKYGYALVGRVEALGEGVRSLRVGDAVFVYHPHQRDLVVPASMAVRLPRALSGAEGIFFASTETALNVVHDAAPRLGEVVVVFGLGVVGLLVGRLLALSGAEVVLVDPSGLRRGLAARFMGDTGEGRIVAPEKLAGLLAGLADGSGVDIAVEVSGSPEALRSAIGCVAAEGTVVVASWYGTKKVSLDLGGHFHRGRVRLKSSQVGSLPPEMSGRWGRDRRTGTVLRLMPRLGLERLVSHRVALENAPEVYQRLDADDVFREGAGQVVIEYRSGQGTGVSEEVERDV